MDFDKRWRTCRKRFGSFFKHELPLFERSRGAPISFRMTTYNERMSHVTNLAINFRGRRRLIDGLISGPIVRATKITATTGHIFVILTPPEDDEARAIRLMTVERSGQCEILRGFKEHRPIRRMPLRENLNGRTVHCGTDSHYIIYIYVYNYLFITRFTRD